MRFALRGAALGLISFRWRTPSMTKETRTHRAACD